MTTDKFTTVKAEYESAYHAAIAADEAFHGAVVKQFGPKDAGTMRYRTKEIAREGFGPTHNGSRNCESGSIASGGTRAHCTCDVCF